MAGVLSSFIDDRDNAKQLLSAHGRKILLLNLSARWLKLANHS